MEIKIVYSKITRSYWYCNGIMDKTISADTAYEIFKLWAFDYGFNISSAEDDFTKVWIPKLGA